MFDTSTIVATGMRPRRILTLEAENAYLRRLLAERDGLRQDADRLLAEQARLAEDAVAGYRREIADGAARLASAEDLNTQLTASEEFNRRILAATTDGVNVLDLDGRLISLHGAAGFFGTASFADIVGRPWIDFWPLPEGRAAVLRAIEAARAGRTSRFQAQAEAAQEASHDGQWWDIVIAPMNGADGSPERLLAVARDITEIKQNEARQTVLMHEMAHRMKNTLAMVQAVATQTLRNAESLDDATEAFGARLLALAQAQDVLMQGSWSSASLAGIVASAVALHSDGEPDRFRVEGVDVTLGPKPALTLALMLHELGTNAAKYGALSVPEGHVAITWEIVPAESEARLRLRWEEIGGPRVSPPTRSGFGSRLIERSLVHSFGGTAKLAFPPTGVVLTMEAPFASVTAGIPPVASA